MTPRMQKEQAMKRTITITEKEENTLVMAILTSQEFIKKLKGDVLADAGSEKFIQLYDEELHRLDDLLARIWGEAL